MSEIPHIEIVGEAVSQTPQTERASINLQGPLRRGLEIEEQGFASELRTRKLKLDTIFIDHNRNDQLFLPGQEREPYTKIRLDH